MYVPVNAVLKACMYMYIRKTGLNIYVGQGITNLG